MKKTLAIMVVALVALTSVFAAWEFEANVGPTFAMEKENAEGKKYAKDFTAVEGNLAAKFYVVKGLKFGVKAEYQYITTPTDRINLVEAFAVFGYDYNFGKFDLGADVGLGFKLDLKKDADVILALDAGVSGAYKIANYVFLNFGLDATFIFPENERAIEIKPVIGLKAII